MSQNSEVTPYGRLNTRCIVSDTPVPAVAMARARYQYVHAPYRRARNCRYSAVQNMKMSMKKPHLMLCFTPNQSESASPAAVVESLSTQKSTVTSGSLAATGWVLNTRSRERTLVGLLLRIADGENGDGAAHQRRSVVMLT